MGGFRGNEIPLEGGFKSAALPPHTHTHTHTHTQTHTDRERERDTLALCSHSSEVICAAGLCASA